MTTPCTPSAQRYDRQSPLRTLWSLRHSAACRHTCAGAQHACTGFNTHARMLAGPSYAMIKVDDHSHEGKGVVGEAVRVEAQCRLRRWPPDSNQFRKHDPHGRCLAEQEHEGAQTCSARACRMRIGVCWYAGLRTLEFWVNVHILSRPPSPPPPPQTPIHVHRKCPSLHLRMRACVPGDVADHAARDGRAPDPRTRVRVEHHQTIEGRRHHPLALRAKADLRGVVSLAAVNQA